MKLGAVAHVRGDKTYSAIGGVVKFFAHPRGTVVTADISGLPESQAGFFALHIHEGGSCCGAGFPETGSHYDPKDVPHPQHAGDLPPLLSCNGHAYYSVLTNRFRIPDILGRTVVIHSHPDDFRSQPAGDAGSKIACGVIRKV